MRHEADLVKGDLYSYLGHFGQRKFLEMGHNDIGDFQHNDAENQDQQLGNFLGSESPTGGGASSVLGNPL